jgi:hypothetical protein
MLRQSHLSCLQALKSFKTTFLNSYITALIVTAETDELLPPPLPPPPTYPFTPTTSIIFHLDASIDKL